MTDTTFALMAQSDDVRLRGRGVIALWLAENTDIPDVLDAAEELIDAMGKADLLTALRSDLDNFIDAITVKPAHNHVHISTDYLVRT